MRLQNEQERLIQIATICVIIVTNKPNSSRVCCAADCILLAAHDGMYRKLKL
jgi:hypothetical protein